MIKARHSNIDASKSRETTHHGKHQVGDLYLENLLGNLRKNMAKLKGLSRTQRRGLAEAMSQKNSPPEARAFSQGNSNPARGWSIAKTMGFCMERPLSEEKAARSQTPHREGRKYK